MGHLQHLIEKKELASAYKDLEDSYTSTDLGKEVNLLDGHFSF